MSIKIEVKDLIKIYGSEPRKALSLLRQGYSREEILEMTGQTVGLGGISFEVSEGEIFVLIGLSGSGKSTALRCINGLIRLTSGSVVVDGHHIEDMSDKELRRFRGENMAMVFQHFAVLPNRTVLDNVAFGLEIKSIPLEERYRRATEALKMVKLEAWRDRYPDELSGGMKQRVGLARALVMNTSILLMDEPFSALDALIRTDMEDELLNLQQEIRKTIIFVTHDLDEALHLGDRIAVMRDGRIEQIGTAEEILSNPANEYVLKFLRKVDVSKVLTAGDVARRPEEILRLTEGPRSAKLKMDTVGVDYLFVTDRSQKVKGIVTMDDILQLIAQGSRSITDAIKEVNTVDKMATLQDVYPLLANGRGVVAVLDEKGRFLGMLTRADVISRLAERGSNATATA